MKLFRKMRLIDKYKIEKSKYPNEHGNYILFHITKTLRGCNYQRVFKGNYKSCIEEKERLEKIKRKYQYVGSY